MKTKRIYTTSIHITDKNNKFLESFLKIIQSKNFLLARRYHKEAILNILLDEIPKYKLILETVERLITEQIIKEVRPQFKRYGSGLLKLTGHQIKQKATVHKV